MKLSVVLASLNDCEVVNTVKSFRETGGDAVEIIVVDDFSKDPVKIPPELKAKVFRNPKRVGVAKSRHFGAEQATGDVLLLTDAHMLCEPGWLEAATPRLENNPRTIFNGSCLGLFNLALDLKNHVGVYTGARLSIYDPTDISEDHRILEGKWKNHGDNAEISCLMGAIYLCPRDVFFAIGGLKSLHMWGCDEVLLSIKAWLAGYEIRQMNTVRMGHKFRKRGESAPYSTERMALIYNKLRCITTLFPKDVADFLFSKFPKENRTALALNKLRHDKAEVDAEREFHRSIFVHNLDWLLKRFQDITFVR